MSDIVGKLTAIKDKIQKAKIEKAKIEGSDKELYQTLKDRFGCETIEEAEIKLSEMEIESDKLEKEIEKGTQELDSEIKKLEGILNAN